MPEFSRLKPFPKNTLRKLTFLKLFKGLFIFKSDK